MGVKTVTASKSPNPTIGPYVKSYDTGAGAAVGGSAGLTRTPKPGSPLIGAWTKNGNTRAGTIIPSSSSGKSTGTGTTTGTGTSDYQQYLASLYANQKTQAQSLAESQRAAAQNAYNAAIGRLTEAWNTKSGALSDNLNSMLDNLKRQYKSSKKEVKADANKSLREAYVNHMMNKKNLDQNLSAQGISGGAAESTMAGMYNNYGNSRNDISNTLNDNLTSLENTYQGNVASAQQQYNDAYANALAEYLNYQNQLEQNLANNLIGSYDSMYNALGNLDTGYSDALMNLLKKQGSFSFENTVNNLGLDTVSTQSLNNMGTVTDAAKHQSMIDRMRQQGMSDDQIILQLNADGMDRNTLYQLFG